jgi:uncharacterized protein YyaL (SSP411 family)
MSEQTGKRWEETRKAWDEVGDRFTQVGRHVSEQYRQQREGQEEEAPKSRQLDDAIARVVRQMDQTFTSLGNVLRAPEAKRTMGDAARSLANALSATFTDLRGEAKKQ